MRTSAAACIIDLSNPFWTYYLIQSSAGKKTNFHFNTTCKEPFDVFPLLLCKPAWLRFRNSHVDPGDGLGDGEAGAGTHKHTEQEQTTHINTLLLFYLFQMWPHLLLFWWIFIGEIKLFQ